MDNLLKQHLIELVQDVFLAELVSFEKIGGGMAGGLVYRVQMDKEPFYIAVKQTTNPAMLKEEYDTIRAIQQHADILLPKLYAYRQMGDDAAYLCMQLFDGVNCASPKVLKAPRATRFAIAAQIADNISKLQAVKNNKFGLLDSPIYDTWHGYYRPFVDMVVKEAHALLAEGLLTKKIVDVLCFVQAHYDQIFCEPIGEPTLIHGDYWAQNIMVDKNFKLVGVLDPFHSMWADGEYELFALNAVYGRKLPVLEAFLARQTVSKTFFLKNAVYILFSETYWVVKLKHDNIAYLNYLIRGLKKQLKKHRIPYQRGQK